MPPFMVKKEVFEWIKTRQKTTELRKGKARAGEEAVFNVDETFSERKLSERMRKAYQHFCKNLTLMHAHLRC